MNFSIGYVLSLVKRNGGRYNKAAIGGEEMQTGQKLAALRKSAGLTQEELAEKLFVSRDLVSKWENGKRRPDKTTLEKAAGLLGAEINDIFPPAPELEKELAGCIPDGFPPGADLTALINAFLGTLSVRDRSVFLQRYHFFEDAAAIGERYGISAAHARTVLMRTRKKLRSFLKEECK